MISASNETRARSKALMSAGSVQTSRALEAGFVTTRDRDPTPVPRRDPGGTLSSAPAPPGVGVFNWCYRCR
jgi:hypothetical protein